MRGTVLHHPAFSKPAGWPFSHDDCLAAAEDVRRQHASSGAYSVAPAYNRFRCQHGHPIEGRGYGRLSGANGTGAANREYWAVCGLVPMDATPSTAMLSGIRDDIDTAPGPGREVLGHYQIIATACPGPLKPWVQEGAPRPDDEEAEMGQALDTLGIWEQETRQQVNDNTFRVVVNAVVELKRYLDERLAATPGGGEMSEDRLRQIIREEIDRTKLGGL